MLLAIANTAFLITIKHVTDEGFVGTTRSSNHLPLVLFILMFSRAILGFFANYTMRRVARWVVEDLRVQAFSHLMRLPVSYFDLQSTGMVVSKLTYDTEQMANTSTRSSIALVRDTLTSVGIFLYMVYLDWKLTLIFVLVTPLMSFYLHRTTPKLRHAGGVVQDSMGAMTRVAEEAITGQRIVKVFGAANTESERFASMAAQNSAMQIRLARLSGLNSMVVEILAACALSLVVYYAVGRFSAGEFTAFMAALLMLIAPIKNLTNLNEDMQVALAAAHSVFSMMDSPSEQDNTHHDPPSWQRSEGSIEFRDVCFQYSTSNRPILRNLSFCIEAGEKIALVGRSGGGKTSLVNVLPRFYELSKGQILLDGIDIRNLPLAVLRQQFSLVTQDVVLFNDTVFNNIAYGVLGNASEDNVIAAAHAAHAWEFIAQLPKGLYSEVGDRGVRLSGGQRQRIAIARAILKDAPILLLDEATSALDSESEDVVQAAIDSLVAGRTSIVIAHRLSTIENADRILVMEQGEIVEQGTHTTLLAINGVYTKLYQRQFGDGIENRS